MSKTFHALVQYPHKLGLSWRNHVKGVDSAMIPIKVNVLNIWM